MTRLLRAELRRLFARRLVRATVVFIIIAIVGGGILAFDEDPRALERDVSTTTAGGDRATAHAGRARTPVPRCSRRVTRQGHSRRDSRASACPTAGPRSTIRASTATN